MFICNVNFNKKFIFKIVFCFLGIIISLLLLFSSYRLISSSFAVQDEINSDVNYLDEKNYTNILKSSYANIDAYIGKKVSFTGFIYRKKDFKDNQFVIARSMLTSDPNVTYIVGFLCVAKNKIDFNDNTWVKINGTIKKGTYNNSNVPIIKITNIELTKKPENEFVSMPDNTYVQTVNMF